MHVVINSTEKQATICTDLSQIAKIIGCHPLTVKRHEADEHWEKRNFQVYFHCELLKSNRGGNQTKKTGFGKK